MPLYLNYISGILGEALKNMILTEQIHFSIETIRKAAKSLKNEKSGGPHEISTELIGHGTQNLYELPRNLFEKLINGENILENCTFKQYTIGEKQ
jgi:hypothetical protein